MIDWDTTLLPDNVTLPFVWAGLIATAVGFTHVTLVDSLWGAVGGYLSLTQRSQVGGLLTGALIGLAQDSLSKNPLGMFGICKTLVGYFAASIGVHFNVENTFIRLFLSFFF